jgi:hypothetical protein
MMCGRMKCRAFGLCLLLMITTPALAQQLGHGDDVGIPWWRLAAMLGLMLALGIGAVFAARSRSFDFKIWQISPNRRLKVIETARLSVQGSLCLVVLDDKEFLIAITASSATVIEKRITGPEPE